jgi:hypothetical protein
MTNLPGALPKKRSKRNNYVRIKKIPSFSGSKLGMNFLCDSSSR